MATTTSSSSTSTCTCTTSSSSSSSAMSSIMTILPTDVIAHDILGQGYVSDPTIQRFLLVLGERRVTELYKLDQQFCMKHGSKLEDRNTFQTTTTTTRNDQTDDDDNSSNNEGEDEQQQKEQQQQQQQQQTRSSLCCPECYAEAQHSKRCNGCKKFQPEFLFGTNDNSIGPGLCCQQCHKIEFCHECLYINDTDTDTDTRQQQQQQQRKQQYGSSRNQFGPGRVTCHNCCCPDRFTNTMCGEFVCLDCHEEHHAKSNEKKNNVVEVCEECQKTTCLDPHCYVCADFKLSSLSISCGCGVPKAADLLRLRRVLTDFLIYSLCVWMVYQIWYGGGTSTGTAIQNTTLLIKN
mmetsp:Transcript_22259/g.22599  ORF Transcript_22259/g.22599 Transcript_22259/m.22599 type:complete len:349 (+) Transcript_22259:33-1079(+)